VAFELSRRHLIAAAAASLAAPGFAAVPRGERRLSLYNIHTGESLKTVFWADGGYVEEGLSDIDRILRDFRTGEATRIDPALLDLLAHVQRQTGATGKTFDVISGYRSPRTNAMLHQRSTAVATKSQHQLGKAIDVRLNGVDLHRLRAAGRAAQTGGVGYYPAENFVHLDTGRVRFW
jgi:uncharacterized protein YcbK (DUF882 family)